jgi:hypothetical protein
MSRSINPIPILRARAHQGEAKRTESRDLRMDACFGVVLLFWTDSAGVKDAETHSVWAGRTGVLRSSKTK